MLKNRLESQGVSHRRWRVALILLLAPFAIYSFTSSGWMTQHLGELAEFSWDIFCLGLALIGLGIRIHMAGHGQVAEAGELLTKDKLNTTGFYSLVRHPVSIANFLLLLSGVLLFKSMFFTALVAAVVFIYYERLTFAKERILLEHYGKEFAAWAARTPLIVPKISAWETPASEFNFRAALKREAVTFALIGVMFFTLETLEGMMIDGLPFWEWVQKEPVWFCLFAVSGIIFWTQLSRIYAISILFMTSCAVGAFQSGKITLPEINTEDRALTALAEGGYVLLLRHASTTGKDEPALDVNNCSTQRVLSDRGREQARAIGRKLRERGIHFMKTVSSQYCRTRETAQIAGAEAIETMSNLNERAIHVTLIEQIFGNNEKDEKILRPIRSIIKDWKEQGNLLLVSHAPIIRNLTLENLSMGEGLVLKPAADSHFGFRVVGKIPRPHID